MAKKLSDLSSNNIATTAAKSKKLSDLASDSFKLRKNTGNPLLYAGTNVALGMGGIVEGATDLVFGTIASLSGHGAYAKSLYNKNEVGDWKKSLDESYNPGKGMKFVGDVGQGLGQSAAFLIPGAGAPLFYAGVIGQGIGEGVQQTGELGAKEYIYGATTGAIEGLLETYVGAGGQLLGNLTGKVGGSVTKKVVSALASKTASQAVWKGVAKAMISGGAGEFVEEFLGDYADTFLQRATGVNENAEYSAARAAYSGLVGFVSGAVSGGTTKAINTQVSYNSGKKVVDNGNTDTLIKQAKAVADGFQTKDTTKLPEALKSLKESISQYENTADKNSSSAVIKLGEIKAYLAMTEVYSGVQEVLSTLDKANDESLTAYAKYMTDFTGKTYTVEDFKADKDKIKTNYASQAWSTLFLKDSKAEVASKKFNDIIAADLAGKPVGKPVVEDISNEAWNGEEAVYSLDDGNYLNVMQGDDGNYSVSWGQNSEDVRGFTGKTMEQTKEILTKIREATAEQRNVRTQNIAVNSQNVQQPSVTPVEALQGTMLNGGTSTQVIGENATTSPQQPQTMGQASRTMNPQTATPMQASVSTYTAQEQDAARKVVKDFDTLSPDTRSAIMEWVKSAQGVNKDVVSAVSFIMSVRPGLQVIYSKLGEGHKGLYANLTEINRRLIVTSGDSNAIRETIAHELTHDLRQSEGWEKLKQAALSTIGDEEKGKIIELYTKTLNLDENAVEEEVVAKTVGKMLTDKTFLERYAKANKLTRIGRTLKNLAEYFKSKGADRIVLTESYKLMQMMDAIIKTDYVKGATAKTESGVKYNLDSEGNTLSPEQIEFFKGSKVRDKSGRLLVVYHGTPNKFTKFDYKHRGSTTDDGIYGTGFYLSSYKKQAQQYVKDGGQLMELYLNMKNPLRLNDYNSVSELADHLDMDESQLHVDNSTNIIKPYLRWADRFSASVSEAGHDGVIVDYGGSDEIVAFEPNQIKQTTNKNPTSNPDIRYNLDNKDDIPEVNTKPLKGKGTLESGDVSTIKNKAQKTQDKVFDYVRVEKTIKGIANLYGVSFDSERSAADKVFEVFNTFEGDSAKMIRDLSEYLVHTEQWVYNKKYKFDNTEQLIDTIEKNLSAVYEGFGKITKLGEAKQGFAKEKESIIKQKEEVREQLNAVIDDLQEKIGKINKANASTIRIMNDIERVRRIKKQRTSGALGNAEYNGLIKTAARIFSKFNLNPVMARQYAKDFVDFMGKYAPQAVNGNMTEFTQNAYNQAVADGDNELLMYLSPDLYDVLKKIADGNGTLSSDELYGLHVALSTMLAMDNRVDKVYVEGQWKDTGEYAEKVMAGVHEQFKGKATRAITNETAGMIKFIVENSIDPEDAVRNVEGYFSDKILSQGIHKIKLGMEKSEAAYYKFIEGSEKFIEENKDFWKSYNEDTVDLTVTRVDFKGTTFKQTLTLTKGEAFQLYMTSKREQAKLALAMGNIKIKDAQRNGEKYKARIVKAIDKKAYASLTDEQFNDLADKMFNNMLAGITQMGNQFSAEDKAFIKLMEDFYNGASKENKKAIDDLLYGKTNVIDSYYVPIVRSEMGRDVNLIQPRIDTMTVGSYSFNKDTVMGARNQLIIGDAYSIFKQHAMQLAKYVHLTIPLQNLQRIYNFRSEDATADVHSPREYISTYVWKGFDNYLKTFYQDVQGTREKTDVVSSKLRMIKGNYAKFAIGANIGSLFKQFSSSIMMMTEVDMESWAKGGHILNKDQVDKYSTLAANRNNPHAQYYAQGASGKLGKVGEAMMWHMKAGDRAACLTMWTMLQHHVEKKYGHEIDSKENLEKSGELLDDAILSIQDTGSAATKSGMARTPNEALSAFTMFRSASIKMLSKLYTAAAESAEVIKRKKAGEEVSDEMMSKTKKRLATVAGAITLSALFEASVSILMNKLKGKYDKEEEEKIAEKLASETALNLIGLVPVAGQLIENWAGGYDTSLFYYDILNDGKNTINGVFKNGTKVISGEYVDTAEIASSVRDLIYFLGTVTGIPTRNINNFATMMLRSVSVDTAYKYGAVFTNDYTATLNSAVSKGNDALAEAVISNLYSEKTGKVDATLSNVISELYAQGYNVLPNNVPTSYKAGDETKTVNADQHKAMKETYSQASEELKTIVTSEEFKAIEPEAQAKVISLTYSAYLSKAKYETLGATPSKLAVLMGYADLKTLMTALGYFSTLSGDKADEVKDYIKKYDKNTQAVILYSAGYSTDSIRKTIKSIVSKEKNSAELIKILGV